MKANEKLEALKTYIGSLESLTVAFSGGVDSSFLLKVAYEVLKDKVLAITARSSTYPEREYLEAVGFTREHGIAHQVIESEELDVEGFSDNPTNRCYLCKNELLTKIRAIADEKGIKHVAEGSNHDDPGDYRPGLIAVKEHGVLSPLRTVGLTKDEIRILSKELGLKSWDKPSFACLSSRFPYGEKITREKLTMVDKAEQLLLDIGFRQVRVRHHGDVARIELAESDLERLIEPSVRQIVYEGFKKIGFAYTALDIKGYRTGSMNETMRL
ncbi:MAG: ATP-dependent sacrificial sulfur transferase LarE [Clostridiales bacterium]|nr:ATP-dependent sacrificial sulfur transferase LarE [Clostridiales bacterium]